MQPNDAIKKLMTPENYSGFCAGKVLQAVYDWQRGAGVEALQHAQIYLTWLIESVNTGGGMTSEQVLMMRRGR